LEWLFNGFKFNKLEHMKQKSKYKLINNKNLQIMY
jgi:hypothetical protein